MGLLCLSWLLLVSTWTLLIPGKVLSADASEDIAIGPAFGQQPLSPLHGTIADPPPEPEPEPEPQLEPP
ncbi:hypothetical protein E4U42_000903, partial [Claviceps africana]